MGEAALRAGESRVLDDCVYRNMGTAADLFAFTTLPVRRRYLILCHYLPLSSKIRLLSCFLFLGFLWVVFFHFGFKENLTIITIIFHTD